MDSVPTSPTSGAAGRGANNAITPALREQMIANTPRRATEASRAL